MVQPVPDLLVAPEARPALARRRRRALKRSGIVVSLLLFVSVAMLYALAEAIVPLRDGALAWLRSSGDDSSALAKNAAPPVQLALEQRTPPATETPKRAEPLPAASRLAANAGAGGSASSRGGSDSDSGPNVVTPPPPPPGPDPGGSIDLVSGLIGSLQPGDMPLDLLSGVDVVGGAQGITSGLIGDGPVGEVLADTTETVSGLGDSLGGGLSNPGGLAGGALSDVGGMAGGALSGPVGGVGGATSDPGGAVGGLVGGLLK